MKKQSITQLKQHNEQIWQKYTQNVQETDINAVYRQGVFLGLHEQLVRLLHRNTGNIPQNIKDSDFFKLALVTYVDLYCQILVRPEFPAMEEDIAAIAISEYYNNNYELIAALPPYPLAPDKTEPGSWARYMRSQIVVYGIRNLALLDVINWYCSQQTGTNVCFQPAEKYAASFGD